MFAGGVSERSLKGFLKIFGDLRMVFVSSQAGYSRGLWESWWISQSCSVMPGGLRRVLCKILESQRDIQRISRRFSSFLVRPQEDLLYTFQGSQRGFHGIVGGLVGVLWRPLKDVRGSLEGVRKVLSHV